MALMTAPASDVLSGSSRDIDHTVLAAKAEMYALRAAGFSITSHLPLLASIAGSRCARGPQLPST